jgi:hypothetical protein
VLKSHQEESKKANAKALESSCSEDDEDKNLYEVKRRDSILKHFPLAEMVHPTFFKLHLKSQDRAHLIVERLQGLGIFTLITFLRHRVQSMKFSLLGLGGSLTC